MDTTANHLGNSRDSDTSPLSLLHVTVGESDGRLLLAGELDATGTELLRRATAEMLGEVAPATVEIDASGLTFLDSSGIRSLLICQKMARAAGSDLVVTNPTPNVYQILEITGLLDLLVLPRSGTPAEPRPPAPTGHGPQELQSLRSQSARLRQAAREVRQRAAARCDDARHLGAGD